MRTKYSNDGGQLQVYLRQLWNLIASDILVHLDSEWREVERFDEEWVQRVVQTADWVKEQLISVQAQKNHVCTAVDYCRDWHLDSVGRHF